MTVNSDGMPCWAPSIALVIARAASAMVDTALAPSRLRYEPWCFLRRRLYNCRPTL